MDTNENKNVEEPVNEAQETTQDQTTEQEAQETTEQEAQETTEREIHEQTPEEKVVALEAELEAMKDKYLRQAAEFDNYRKRTMQEKADLLKYGAQKAVEALLPVVDDIERAMQHIEKAEDVESVKEGMNLIYQKFQKYLEQQQVSVIPANQGDDFDDNIHEAVTMFPAPDPSLKGKIVDCVTKGYKLSDKVVRYAKVVVGQ